jgi:hypothetical protein
MKEKEWVKSIIDEIQSQLRLTNQSISVSAGHRLNYSIDVLSYGKDNKPSEFKSTGYETDILISEEINENEWKPRIIVETKLAKLTTHDAITYSQKAEAHKNVHPYLRYGILIGNSETDSLRGRVFRHGLNFDFMLMWNNFIADKKEMKLLIKILNCEIEASRNLDKILFDTRKRNREKFTALHRELKLTK